MLTLTILFLILINSKNYKCGNFGFHPRVMCTAKKCMGDMSRSRISEHQNCHEKKLGNLISGCSFCAF